MVSNVVSAIVTDALTVGRDEAFFAQAKEERSQQLAKQLGSDYPQPLRAYLSTVTADTFVKDLEQLIPTLGSDGSVFSDVPELMAGEGNGFFQALLDALTDELRSWLTPNVSTTSRLGQYCAHIGNAGSLYTRILVREAQELLLAAKQIDSPLLQVATDLTAEEQAEMLKGNDMPGIPSVITNKELLGGVRQFYNGTMQDDSWRARLTRVLRVVS